MILASAQGDSNAHIARELRINVDTVRLWRDRWVGLQGIDLDTLSVAERLQDAPRPGRHVPDSGIGAQFISPSAVHTYGFSN